MPDKYQDKYRIPSARLQTWDYGSNAAYFITICTKHRLHSFGEIVEDLPYAAMELNVTGKLAKKYWLEIPLHFSFIELGNFVIMPNHMHGILIIDKPRVDRLDVETRRCLVSTIPKPNEMASNDTIPNETPSNDTTKKQPGPSTNNNIGQMRFQNQGKHTISSIVGSYKSVVYKNARFINSQFGWQRLFYDHIIRDARSFETIQNYIANNPSNWRDDKFNK
ncbi:MAG: hypothetical protein ABIN01_14105 [Ferruginibacter sp.]